MICMLDMFKNCLILRHRRSHDITVPSTKNVFNLTRSSSTTSIISCTKKQDDLPPLSTLPRSPNASEPYRGTNASSPSMGRKFSDLPQRPNSIADLPSIAEVPKVEIPTNTTMVTIIEVKYCKPSNEPQYSEPFSHTVGKVVERKDLHNFPVVEEESDDKSSITDGGDYPSYQDIYEEIRHRDTREDDLPDVVTSAYASGEQVYQELLDLVKEEEIKEEKRMSLLLSVEDSMDSETMAVSERSDDSSDCSDEKKNSLEDLYAVPQRTKTNGPRLPPRRVKSNCCRDPDWAPKVPEKSSLLRRSLSDVGGPNVDREELTESKLSVIDEKIYNDIYEELHVRSDRLI